MAESMVTWPWLFQPGPQTSEALKETNKELVEDEADLADLDFTTDEFPVKISGCIAYKMGSVVEKTPEDVDNDFEVDFKQQVIKLPTFVANCYSIDPCIKANHIRYVDVVGGVHHGVSCDDKVLLLSLWKPDGREIINIYFRMPGIKETLMLANSVLKLLYEGSGKSQMRLKTFTLICSGDVMVSTCSVEERDTRESLEFEKGKKMTSGKNKPNGHTGTLEADSVPETKEVKDAEDLKPLEEERLFFMLDEEALSFFEHPLSPKTFVDFRFYKEAQDNAIDVIYVSNMTQELEIEQQQKVFYIKSVKKEAEVDEDFVALSKALRGGKIKPKTKDAFADLKSFTNFGDNQLPNSKPTIHDHDSSGKNHSHSPTPHAASKQQQTPQWLTLLSTGSHLNNGDEDMQVMWFKFEDELEACRKADLIPDMSNELLATDPESFEHLLTLVEQIRDKLMSNDFIRALSLLRGIMSIFGKTLLKNVAQLSEVELLKRIFFVTE